jgi:hypothetical protein
MMKTFAGTVGLAVLFLSIGCGRDAGEPGVGNKDVSEHYPSESSFDSAREAPPATPAPMDNAIKSAPEAGKELNTGDTGVRVPPNGKPR